MLFDAQNNLLAIFGLDTNSAAITRLLSSSGSLNLFGSNGLSSRMRLVRPPRMRLSRNDHEANFGATVHAHLVAGYAARSLGHQTLM